MWFERTTNAGLVDALTQLESEMKLREAILAAETGDENRCIVARRPWNDDSECSWVHLTEDYRVPESAKAAGYEHFLEVSINREEFGVCWAALFEPQRVDAVIFYPENDAFPRWLNELP